MTIVRRSQWGARKKRSVSHNITPEKGGVAIHYEGPHLGNFPHSQCSVKVRNIQNFHMDGRKWADIAYTVMVCPHGYIFECRGLNVRTAANGTNEANQNYYAVCVLTGAGDTLTVAAKEGVLEAIQYLRQHGNAGTKIKGHRDFKATACPGDALYDWIKKGCPDPSPPRPAAPHRPTHKHPYPVPTRVLKFDSRKPKSVMKGEDVKWVQDKVNHFYKKQVLKVDGEYGPITAGWVKKYQQAVKLRLRDGITGPDTVKHLKLVK